jgi:tRNA(Ile)-lysidine synthase TilS/MesJ
MTVTRCTRCILPETFPNITFDDRGVCSYCREVGDVQQLAVERQALQSQLDALFHEAKANPKSGAIYDVVVAYSGGKDSTYTLKLLRERYQLNCLAVTIDNGFLSESTFENCRTIADRLSVDHIFFKPAFDFMRRLYQLSVTRELHVKSAIKRASAICNSCINLVNVHMINVALQNGVSIVAGGYLGGQLPRGKAHIELNRNLMARMRESDLAKYERHLGAVARNYFALHANNADDSDNVICVVNPLVAFDYDEAQIVREITALGWKPPKDTGLNSTNCMLNDVGIAIHQRRHGFHPYEPELAQLVREGRMERSDALRKVETIPSGEVLQPILQRLSLKEEQFEG